METKSSHSKRIAVATVVALAAIGGYVVGRSQPHRTDATAAPASAVVSPDRYDEGLAAGRAQGKKEGERQGYARGYRAASRKATQTINKAVSDSFDAGAKAIFDGFDSPWVAGSYYIVKVDGGPHGIPYQLSSRIQMKTSNFYDLCSNSPGICGGSSADLSTWLNGSGPDASAPPTSPPSVPSLPTPHASGPANLLPPYPAPCADGTISPSGGHQGACSHHGGEL